MEQIREIEKQTLAKMDGQIYEKQKKMQKLQSVIEKIQESNTNAEQQFEDKINDKNQQAMEAGQIVNSVQNIYDACGLLAAKKNKSIKPIDLENLKVEQGKSMNETYIESIILMLETGTEYLEDLKSVIKHMNNE